MNSKIKIIVSSVLFVLFLVLVVVGQRHIGYAGLGTMMVGLAGLLGLLWMYNKQYQ
ncbi:DUF6903 family protein [Schleiferilactobacillus perolens]|jgi:hypothetical protein|uniref:Uncharacterized protein n=1 Tax=Schleiferilactobacillus perolens DSM 12744 TaxID=1423792 RepID=A0A0R1N3D0_9LACO|nr:hypothetical protein [Schleiferilactobacillus perolens]KRL14688.1 hypothetical protein FD09_GL000344 [Schleiferilactobacillus perolens DSM 12744]MCI1893094.1 hypothetical protein [Schleiferilactobacillus harbinensis]MCI1912554.1 hypothetical protein [Schleiferilactobacillus harbinensis]MCI2169977.1 hypothetical protein [Schleiferilactobacillus perolens]